jgi:hypothetical protein
METISTKGATSLMSKALNRYVSGRDIDYFIRRGLLQYIPSRGLRKQRAFETEKLYALADAILAGRHAWPERSGNTASNGVVEARPSVAVPTPPAPTEVAVVVKKSHTFEITRDVREAAVDTLRTLVADGREITLLVELHPE